MKLESLENAEEELKRADHLFYVSLKYTRTVDVIKSIIERLINAYTFGIEALAFHLKEEGKLDEIPRFPRLKANAVGEAMSDDEKIKDYIEFYVFLRKADKAEFTRKQEFRRHVTMIAQIDGKTINIKIDDIKEYFEKVKTFISYAETIIIGEDEFS